MTAAIRTLPGVRVLHYHNITPAHYFAPYDAGIARLTILARQELATLAGHVDLALGASEFSRTELDEIPMVFRSLPSIFRQQRSAPSCEPMLFRH